MGRRREGKRRRQRKRQVRKEKNKTDGKNRIEGKEVERIHKRKEKKKGEENGGRVPYAEDAKSRT